jgi:hypothetical protein
MGDTNVNKASDPHVPYDSVDRRSPGIRKAATYLAALAVAAGVLALVLLSPLLLRQLGHIRGINWTQLSNIGQTYGAASAILSQLP